MSNALSDISIHLNPGFSVYVDHNRFDKKLDKNNPNGSFSFKNDEKINSELHKIYPKYNEKWVDSSLVSNCQQCNKNFDFSGKLGQYINQINFILGKHHCRACGGVFCGDCCNKNIVIPRFIKKPKEGFSMKQQIANIVGQQNTNESLVCHECHVKIKKLDSIVFNLSIAEFFNLDTLYCVMMVNKNWYNACIHYLSKFRGIQYRSSYQLYDDWEFNIMHASSNMLNAHSNWNVHLIKSNIQVLYQKNNNEYLKKKINNNKKTHQNSCWNMMCSRRCNLELDLLDYIEILKFISMLNNKKNIIWKDNGLKEYLLYILDEIVNLENNINSLIIKNIMPLLCSILIFLLDDDIEDIDDVFVKNMLDKILYYPNAIHYFYDEIQYLRGTNNQTMGIFNLIDILNDYLKRDKNNGIDEKEITRMKDTIANIINSKNNNNIKYPILYPLDYNWKIYKINRTEIMKSNSEPVLFDVTIMNSYKVKKNVKFLVKKENTLRKEQIVSSIIYLLLFRLKQQGMKSNKNFESIPAYQIKMLTNTIGVIEFVENSVTLREINDKGYTIQNYISEINKNDILDNIKGRFMNSLAISCCISYLLGLGDRHLDNIMINKKGQIFNIDYGFLLENPKTNILGAPNIKVTSGMIDFLGGQYSEYYKNFKQFLIYVYDIMRLYKNIISDHIELLGNEKFIDWIYCKDKLESRFMSGLIIDDIVVILTKEIESSESIGSSFNDACHSLKMWWEKKKS
jgi:Phosphatidylinositol 3- and 4-kinase/FYVE zinc finger